MTHRLWEHINPLEFNDGVFYLPAMVELQPRQSFWGHPNQPGLRERLANDRPHGIGGGKLLCLLCMRIRAERGLPLEPVWLTFVEGRHGPMFRHEDGRSPHAEHQPETDIHKAIKEREARTFEAAGALEVDVEVWRPRARRRPDIYAKGPALTVAGEVQHSTAPSRSIQARQRALSKAGDRVIWTTDRNAADIGFLHLVPHLAVPTVKDHRFYLHTPQLAIASGVTVFERQRCGWTDLWTNTPRCPVTRKAKPCGGWHLYPTLNPSAYQSRPVDPAAHFPYGPRPHLDHLLEGILHGSWLPYRHRNRVTWIPADAHDQVATERGGSVEQAENATVRRRDAPAGRACEERVGLAIPAQRSAPREVNAIHGWWIAARKPIHPGCNACHRAPGGPWHGTGNPATRQENA